MHQKSAKILPMFLTADDHRRWIALFNALMEVIWDGRDRFDLHQEVLYQERPSGQFPQEARGKLQTHL